MPRFLGLQSNFKIICLGIPSALFPRAVLSLLTLLHASCDGVIRMKTMQPCRDRMSGAGISCSPHYLGSFPSVSWSLELLSLATGQGGRQFFTFPLPPQ